MTAEDIAGISIFAGLGPAECDRLSRNAADIRLVPGEYAVHQGDERALFAVLEGRLETVGLVDGIPTVVGGRKAGELFGEVPIALGTPFPLGFRAAEPTRVMRVAAGDYHAIAAASSGDRRAARRVGARADRRAARHRRRGAAATGDRARSPLGRGLC